MFAPSLGWRARPRPLKGKNEYLVLALRKKFPAKAVVGFIIWAFRRLKNPRCREMSARGYALHSICPNFLFSFFVKFTPGVATSIRPYTLKTHVKIRYSVGDLLVIRIIRTVRDSVLI